MPFGLRTRVGPGSHVLHGVEIPHGTGQFWGGKGRPIVRYRDTAVTYVKIAEPIVMQFGLWARSASRNHEMNGGPNLPREWAILGKGSPTVKYRHFLPWSVEKRLNQSICCLGCGLRSAEGSASSTAFVRWSQCALLCGHIGATWQIQLNRPSAAAMRSYVKLLWPLVLSVNLIFNILWESE